MVALWFIKQDIFFLQSNDDIEYQKTFQFLTICFVTVDWCKGCQITTFKILKVVASKLYKIYKALCPP